MALNNPYALNFDGINDYASVNVSDTFICNPGLTGQLTLEYWAYHYELGYDDFSTGADVSNTRGICIRNNYVFLATSTKLWSASLSYALNQWEHIALVWDGILLKHYRNGILQKSITAVTTSRDNILTTLYIARRSGSAVYNHIRLDELRIWNYARSQEQIQNSMHVKLIGSEPGLYLYYRMDDGTGNVLVDSSSTGRNGTIQGATWITGAIDLTEPANCINLSATAHGRASSMTKLLRGRPVGATAYSHTVSTVTDTIRLKGLRAIAYGQATGTARPYKTANARSITRGRATATATMLVLFIPPGVYSIDADNIFNRNQPITPDSLANYIEVWVNPLKPVDVAEEVYKTGEDDPFSISASETKTVTIHYKKEPVTEVVISLLDAPAYATITNIRYYAWGADVTVTSPDAGTFRLVATGKPLEVQGRELVVKKNETSILENGIKKYTFDNEFVQDRATAEIIAEKLLGFAIPQADIEIDWRGDPAIVLADVVMIPEFQRQGLDQRGVFYVTKQELEYDGGLRAKLTGRKMMGGGT